MIGYKNGSMPRLISVTRMTSGDVVSIMRPQLGIFSKFLVSHSISNGFFINFFLSEVSVFQAATFG